MADKIHCDLLEVYGPDWVSIGQEQIQCLADTIHTMDELMGRDLRLFGFVGTQRTDSIVGGYFAIQYEEEELHYDKQKRLDRRHSAPFARLFFVLFAATGKLLLQNSKFAGIPLKMSRAKLLFQRALNQALAACNLQVTIGFYPAPDTSEGPDFVEEFERSTRVVRLEVTYPNADRIPTGFEYYNPIRERNPIILDSHRHDYPHLKKVDLEAVDRGDLKKTHLRDLVIAAEPQFMKYYVGREELVMRRQALRKFEFYVDMKAEQLSEEGLRGVVDLLRRERAVFLDTPTSELPQESQIRLFDILDEDDQ